jgi:hypothetical protein
MLTWVIDNVKALVACFYQINPWTFKHSRKRTPHWHAETLREGAILYMDRRRFFSQGLLAVSAPTLPFGSSAVSSVDPRIEKATEIRTRAAKLQSLRQLAPTPSNGDETNLPEYIGCFAKGLPHTPSGLVEPQAYTALLKALKTGEFADFERLPRAGGRTLSNPISAFAFHLEGGDPHTFEIPPAPSIASSACQFDSSELYWQSLCRDVPFAQYQTSPVIQQAAAHLGTTPANAFRGPTKGDLDGPYISQFLLKPIPYGAGRLEQRYNVPLPGSDFMTTLNEWSQIQTGISPWLEVTYDPVPRYIRNGRDLSEFVHYDFAYQAHLAAALILINANAKSIHNCNQFKSGSNPYRYSTIQDGFATFGPAEACDWLGRVTTAALKAAYFQKWSVHRRVRPEALGGLIHSNRTGLRKYPVHDSVLNSPAVDATFAKHGSYLLPQAYPEGCPLHPSYPSGHASIAGACAVILKACYDGTMLLPACVEPSDDGTKLVPCKNYSPTINDEINKLAFNIAMGRDWAGIHYRSDTLAGLQLGEAVGISVLQDLVTTFTETFRGLSLERFDGTRITILPGGELVHQT